MRELPTLSEETVELLFLKTQTLGALELCDLKYITEQDLADIISPIQCRKLVDAITPRRLSGNILPTTRVILLLYNSYFVNIIK